MVISPPKDKFSIQFFEWTPPYSVEEGLIVAWETAGKMSLPNTFLAESLSSRDSTRNSRSVSLLHFESMSLDDVLAELCHHLQEGSMNSKLGPEFIFWGRREGGKTRRGDTSVLWIVILWVINLSLLANCAIKKRRWNGSKMSPNSQKSNIYFVTLSIKDKLENKFQTK